MIFIDSNIPMYAAGGESPHKDACIAFLQRVIDGEVAGLSSAEVLQEILHRYRAIRQLQKGCAVYEAFRALPIRWLEVTVQDTDYAKNLLADTTQLSSRDALHLAVMHRAHVTRIVTYDHGFLGIRGITVYEPGRGV